MTTIDGAVPCTSALGAYLRALRCAAGLRQQDVVDMVREKGLGVKPSTKEVWAWEKGIYHPSNLALVLLIEVLGGSPLDTASLIRYDGENQGVIRTALDTGDARRARDLACASTDYGVVLAEQRRLQPIGAPRTFSLNSRQEEQRAIIDSALHSFGSTNPCLAELLVHFARFLLAEGTVERHAY